jgi:PAS domain S-box-containing protein
VSFDDDGTILAVNHMLLDLLGYRRDELEGRAFETILPPATRVFYQSHFFPLLRIQGKAEEVYFLLRASDGNDVPVLTYGVRREVATGFVNECVLIRVTLRERYQEELARARELLIAVLGHDLRVPLTAVSLGAEQLLHDEGLSPESRRTALAVLASTRRAARMTADLLDFARVRFAGGIPVQRAPVDLRVVLEKVIAELRAIYPSVPIDVRIDGDCRGSWDADRTAQVMTNLLGNAIDHGREGAVVAVDLEGGKEAVVLEVRNVAEAIDDPTLQNIFSPFDRRSGSGGLGLGLFVAREVAQAHGGGVTASRADGQFVIRVVLPRS